MTMSSFFFLSATEVTPGVTLDEALAGPIPVCRFVTILRVIALSGSPLATARDLAPPTRSSCRLRSLRYRRSSGNNRRCRFYQLLSYKGDVDLETKLEEWERFYNFGRPHGAFNGNPFFLKVTFYAGPSSLVTMISSSI